MREIRIPFQLDSTGGVAYVEGERATLNQHLMCLLGTEKGERVMRATYGTRFRSQLFDPVDRLRAPIQEEAGVAVRTWEPQVTVDEVRLLPQPSYESGIFVEVRYRVVDVLGSTRQYEAMIAVGGTVEERRG